MHCIKDSNYTVTSTLQIIKCTKKNNTFSFYFFITGCGVERKWSIFHLRKELQEWRRVVGEELLGLQPGHHLSELRQAANGPARRFALCGFRRRRSLFLWRLQPKSTASPSSSGLGLTWFQVGRLWMMLPHWVWSWLVHSPRGWPRIVTGPGVTLTRCLVLVRLIRAGILHQAKLLWLASLLPFRPVDTSTGCGEARRVTSEEAQVSHKVLEETGLGGDEEVQEDAVVEGDASQQEQEVAVRVAAEVARRLRRGLAVQTPAIRHQTKIRTSWEDACFLQLN